MSRTDNREGGICISIDPNISQSREYCLNMIRKLENSSHIPTDRFAGKTAQELERVQARQLEELKKIEKLLLNL